MLLVDVISLDSETEYASKLNSCISCGNAWTGKIKMVRAVVWLDMAYVHIVKSSYFAKQGGCIHIADGE